MLKKQFPFLIGFLICLWLFLITGCSPSQTNTPTPPEPTLAPLATPALPAIYQKMASVVQGQGVPEAAIYNPNSSSPPRIVLLNPAGEPYYLNDHVCFPHEWQPASVNEVELVVVISPQREVELDKQSYIGGPPITRYRFERDVEIRQAQSGEVVWMTTLLGSEPPPFPATAPEEQERLVGSEPSVLDIFQYLRETICTLPSRCPSLYPVIENEEPWYLFFPSPDGSLVVLNTLENPNVVQLWQPAEGKQVGELLHSGFVDWMEFSRDGQFLATITSEGKITVWRLSDRQPLWTFDSGSMIFSPDSQLLAVGDKTGEIQIYRLSDQTLLQTVKFGYAMIDMAISPDSNYLAVLSDHQIEVWKIANGERTLQWQFDKGLFKAVAFSPDSRVLTSLATGEIRYWNVENGKLIDTIPLEKGGWIVERITFSPNGKYFALTYSDGWFQIWRFADKNLLYTFEGVVSFGFSPQGDYIATKSKEAMNDLTIRRIQDGEPMRTIFLDDVVVLRGVDFGFIHYGLDFRKIMVCPGNLWEKAVNR